MKLFRCILFTILTATAVNGINIATKLDFVGENVEKPKFVEKVYVVEKKEDKKDTFDKIGVVCVSGGCNTTKIEPSDTISTDIVVEVKTNIDVNENKTKPVEEIPDVPIVIGYAGTSASPNSNINPDINAINPNPILLTNVEQSDYHHHHHIKNSEDSISPTVSIEIKPRPIIVRGDQDYDNVRYNGIQNPYFDPTYTKYYYNTNPSPQQSTWHSRHNGVNVGPLGFNRIPKPDWRASVPWYSRRQGNNYNRNTYYRTTTPSGLWTTCTCHPNAAWYPTTASFKPLNQEPGTQINDKLSPLN